MKKFIFTCGDVNGIGPEIVIKCLNKITDTTSYKFIFICPKNIFENTAKLVYPKFEYKFSGKVKSDDKTQVLILHKGNVKQEIGKPTKHSGKAAFDSIKFSFKLLDENLADAVITAPISKEAINMSGKSFPGHTEMYAKWCKTENFAMMFFSEKINTALVTIHEPVKNISKLLTRNLLQKKINVIIKTLREDLKIENPKIAVLGLNPHAGENGIIGNEEQKIIIPVLNKKGNAQYLSGPFSPDAFFGSQSFKNFDLVIGMYHDQVLIPFKLLNFSSGVNFTAGLPIIRTSPDHGTAFDIAGKNSADESSILEAFYFAEKIVKNRSIDAGIQ